MMLTGNVRTNIEQEIAEEAKIDPSTVIIDVSSAPSVPYYARQQKPQDIPLYNETPDGEKHLVSFSSQSPLGDTLVGYLDIMRVYTPQKDREAVRKAAESKFGKTSVSTQISY